MGYYYKFGVEKGAFGRRHAEINFITGRWFEFSPTARKKLENANVRGGCSEAAGGKGGEGKSGEIKKDEATKIYLIMENAELERTRETEIGGKGGLLYYGYLRLGEKTEG